MLGFSDETPSPSELCQATLDQSFGSDIPEWELTAAAAEIATDLGYATEALQVVVRREGAGHPP